MDNITKTVVGILALAGILAFLTPSNPNEGSSKDLSANPSARPLATAKSGRARDAELAQDAELSDEDEQTENSEDGDESADDFDVKDFGKPSVGDDNEDISSNSLPSEIDSAQDNGGSDDEPSPVAASPNSPPPARWDGQQAPPV